MKRQHPDNPDLFWCPKCRTYKVRGEFGYARDRKQNIAAVCKLCNNNWGKTNKEKRKETAKKYRESHKKECKERTVAWARANKDRLNRKRIQGLADGYVVHCMRRSSAPVTPETIELTRQRIIMKRTLKQFKEWRKEYESNNPDVQREQRENEETDGRQGHVEP